MIARSHQNSPSITLSRFSIRLAQDVALHLSLTLAASQAALTTLSEPPRGILIKKLVKWSSVYLRAWRGTPEQGPSISACDNKMNY